MTTTTPVSPYQPALDRFLEYCHVKSYPAKSTILRVGDNNNTLYFILET